MDRRHDRPGRPGGPARGDDHDVPRLWQLRAAASERLLVIDKDTGSVVSDVGAIAGLGQKVHSGEDLSFDDRGNLYVTDNKDDHLCRGPQTG